MRRWPALLGGMALAVVVCALGFACIDEAMVDENLDQPALALRWRPDDAQALAQAADDEARAATSPAQWRDAATLARRALVGTPLEPQALRVLAWAAAQEGRPDRADAIMSVAGRLTQRDNRISGWLLASALDGHNWPDAFAHADAMLRRNPELSPGLFPAIIGSLQDSAARQAIVERLAWRPDWRSSFLTALVKAPDASATALAVFNEVDASRSPLTQEEKAALLNALVADQDYAAAKSEWQRFLPAPAAGSNSLLYDGSFRGLPGPPPFNWDFVDSNGAVSEIASAPDGAEALHLQYPTERSTPLLQQLLVLPPGSYRLTGAARFDRAGGGDQLVWRIDCADGGKLAEKRLGPATNGWNTFSIDFTTPAAQCAAQRLAVASVGQEDFGSRDAWLRNLSLTRSPS